MHAGCSYRRLQVGCHHHNIATDDEAAAAAAQSADDDDDDDDDASYVNLADTSHGCKKAKK